MLIWIMFFILLALMLSSFPIWPYSIAWGYYPTGLLSLLLLLTLVFIFLGWDSRRRGKSAKF